MRKPLKLVELMTDEKYKEMDVDQLTYVIDYQLEFEDYEILVGEFADGKAKNLYKYFHM